MADELVTLQLGKIFSDFALRIERLRERILEGARPIVRREWAISVRQRWFESGRTLQSARDEFYVREGNVRGYRLFPTAVSERGAPYPLFGEYGTGRQGAATGKPAPAGYRYGQRRGMKARRFARHALAIARPQIELSAIRKTRQFAQDLRVN